MTGLALDEPVLGTPPLTMGPASRSAAGLDAPLFVAVTPRGWQPGDGGLTTDRGGEPRGARARWWKGVRGAPAAAKGGFVLRAVRAWAGKAGRA